LYDIYFRPYTEKVWGLDCKELSADWASERIKLPSLSAAVRGSLLRGASAAPTLVSRFLYPPLGIGMIPERMAAEALGTGRATIHLNSHVHKLEPSDPPTSWKVTHHQDGRDQVIHGQHVVSTIPLGTLIQSLPANDATLAGMETSLTYRGVICILLAIDGARISGDTWTYFPDPHLLFGRTHEPPNWSPQMAPAGKTSLCVEVFASVHDETWRTSDEELVNRALSDLTGVQMLGRERVQDVWVVRAPEAYPVYRVGYADDLQRVRTALARWPTLHLLGRTGSFRYLNLDGVIDQALQMAETLTGGA
jgi:protoporphyrinogen oxidase